VNPAAVLSGRWYLLVILPAQLAVYTAQVVIRFRQVVDFSRFLPFIGIRAIV
jgi:hypothetical protein